MRPDLESAFVRAHFTRAKKARYRSLLGTKRGRETLLGELYHLVALLEPSHVVELGAAAAEASALRARLQAAGAAQRCYVLSVDAGLDNQEMDWADAIPRVVATEGSLALDTETLVAVYRGEDVEGVHWIG